MRRRFSAVAAAGLAAVLSACAPQATTGAPGQVDVPYYETVESLAASSDAVLVGHVVGSETMKEYPRFSEDDPELNPYAGTGRTPSTQEIEAAATIVTVHTVQVETVVGVREVGGLQPGSSIEVVESGGTLGGVTEAPLGSVLLERGDEPLLFLRAGELGYHVLGVDQGRFLVDEAGVYKSTAPGRSDLNLPAEALQDLENVIDGADQ